MAEVTFSQASLGQLRRIRDYIAQDSERAARELLLRIDNETSRLEDYPCLGRQVPEVNNPNIRELIVGAYRVVYRYDERADTVTIAGVMHGRQILPPDLTS